MAEFVEADTKIAERGFEQRQQAHIVQRIGEQAADQEFQREVIDPLAAGVVALFVRAQPAMHHAVAQRQGGSLVPVVLGGECGFLADCQPQFDENSALDVGKRQFIDSRILGLEFCWD